jgi:acyl-CoA synthetase (AMP-forming)/AMP-acid ligase II
MVRPSIDFISLAFALFKTGAVTVLIDPGMGRASLLECLEAVEPDGFVAIPLAHAVRILFRRRFPRARANVTVGRRWFWAGPTIGQLRQREVSVFRPAQTRTDDPAAIIFTTGSTGPPKGVLYRHGNFDQQVEQIRDRYRIEPGEIDLPGFPLFGLFNSAMGVTTVIPDMDPSRPAQVNPERIVEAVDDWQVTQSFGSPAIWHVVGRYCAERGVRLPSLRRVLSAGAPVPPHVLQRVQQVIADDGDVQTPYGATEALPVASISARQVLSETAARTWQGAGTCVGKRFSGIQWKVIRIQDGPLETIDQVEELPVGEIGELIVRGAVVTDRYVTRTEANRLAKIQDGAHTWHRMGDVGYLDQDDRFWFCGRLAHRVRTAAGTMYSVCCEAIFNQHPRVYRSALVGIGPPGQQTPAVVVQPWPDQLPTATADRDQLIGELAERAAASPLTSAIPPSHILIRQSLPVDIRHNAKIFREKLAVWAQQQLQQKQK